MGGKARWRALLYIRLWWIAALLDVESVYTKKLWTAQSDGQFLFTARNYVPKGGHKDIELVGPDSCPGFFRIASAEDKTSLVAWLGCKQYVCLDYCEEACAGNDATHNACD